MNYWNNYSYLTNPFWANQAGRMGLPYSSLKGHTYKDSPQSTYQAAQKTSTPPPSNEGAGTVASGSTTNYLA